MAADTTSRDPIDEAGDESFPASDPPQWSGAHAGPPDSRGRAVDPPAGTALRTVAAGTSVPEAAERLERAITAAGMKVFARIDQEQEARAVGLAMPPTVLLLFGNPRGGTPVMLARPTTAIDLPLKALVWQDAAGGTWLTYNTPALLERRHGLDPALAATLAPAGKLLERALAG